MVNSYLSKDRVGRRERSSGQRIENIAGAAPAASIDIDIPVIRDVLKLSKKRAKSIADRHGIPYQRVYRIRKRYLTIVNQAIKKVGG